MNEENVNIFDGDILTWTIFIKGVDKYSVFTMNKQHYTFWKKGDIIYSYKFNRFLTKEEAINMVIDIMREQGDIVGAQQLEHIKPQLTTMDLGSILFNFHIFTYKVFISIYSDVKVIPFAENQVMLKCLKNNKENE